MGSYYRAQVLLEPEQYNRLRALARRRSLRQGKRVSVSQVIRELLDESLAEEQHKWQQAQEALDDLFALGDAVQERWQGEWPADWIVRIREERADAIYTELFDRR